MAPHCFKRVQLTLFGDQSQSGSNKAWEEDCGAVVLRVEQRGTGSISLQLLGAKVVQLLTLARDRPSR